MKFIYLKSIDAFINLEHVAEVRASHKYAGDDREYTLIRFVSSDSQCENEQVSILIEDPDDRAELRKRLNDLICNPPDYDCPF